MRMSRGDRDNRGNRACGKAQTILGFSGEFTGGAHSVRLLWSALSFSFPF